MALFTRHIDKNKNSDKIKSRLGCGEVTSAQALLGGRGRKGDCPATLEAHLVASYHLRTLSPRNLCLLPSASSLGKEAYTFLHIPKGIPAMRSITIPNKQTTRWEETYHPPIRDLNKENYGAPIW